MKYQRICKNPKCGKEFWGTKTQQYCCLECRPPRYISKRMAKENNKKPCTLEEVIKQAKEHGMSYGQYVAMLYKEERMKK